MRTLVLLTLLAAGAAQAEPLAAFTPMAFLAGHCWKADMPVAGQTDTHCFEWLYGGKALRDTHTVRTPAKPDYVGETTYYFDSVANTVEYIYIENHGGVSRGKVESAPGAIVFPATQHVYNGRAMTYRSRWTPAGDDAYEALSETLGKDGKWGSMFKVRLQRVGK